MHHCLWGMDADAHRLLRPPVRNTVRPPADSYLTSSVPSNFHSSVRPPPIHLFFLRPSVKIKKIMKNNQGRISLPVGPRAKICQRALALCQADGYSIHKILLKIMNSGAWMVKTKAIIDNWQYYRLYDKCPVGLRVGYIDSLNIIGSDVLRVGQYSGSNSPDLFKIFVVKILHVQTRQSVLLHREHRASLILCSSLNHPSDFDSLWPWGDF